MIRNLIMSTIVIAAALEPAMPDLDLTHYVVTQGGLLAVVLILLWTLRKDYQGILREQGERLKVMTDLVTASTVALTRSADATERMARAVENLDRSR